MACPVKILQVQRVIPSLIEIPGRVMSLAALGFGREDCRLRNVGVGMSLDDLNGERGRALIEQIRERFSVSSRGFGCPTDRM